MSIEDIIRSVRFCIDEEANNSASFLSASSGDKAYMDNIITNKIEDALRWVCLYAPAELLEGTDESVPTGILVDLTPTPVAAYNNMAGVITLSPDFIKLARVRVSDWHRAIRIPFLEDSDEYLQLMDSDGAAATNDRPQAAIINKAVKQLELWPWTSGKTVSMTYVASVAPTGVGNPVTGYALPPKARTSIIYYLAFLVLSAYDDPRASRMLEIAKMNLGGTEG